MIGRPTQETGYSLEQLIQTLVQDFTLQKKEKDVIPYFPFFCNIKTNKFWLWAAVSLHSAVFKHCCVLDVKLP